MYEEKQISIIIEKLKTYYGKQIESQKFKNMPCWLKFQGLSSGDAQWTYGIKDR